MVGIRRVSRKQAILGALIVGGMLLLAATLAGTGLQKPGGRAIGSSAGGAVVAPAPSALRPEAQKGAMAQSYDGAAPMAGPAAPNGKRESAGNPEVAPLPSGQVLPPLDRMIIYTTSISLTVNDVAQAVEQVTELVQRGGGFIVGSNIRQESDQTFATLTLRVPAPAYQDTMAALRRLGVKVPSEQGQSKDVTEEFADLEAQVRNLQVTEAQLQELMKRATTIEEILRVQSQLNNVRGQIERLKGRMNYLQRNADLATITVNLNPVGAPRGKPEPLAWDPIRIAREAWEDSLRFLQSWAEVGIRVAVFSWWLLPPALAAWVIWNNYRSRRRVAAQAPQG